MAKVSLTAIAIVLPHFCNAANLVPLSARILEATMSWFSRGQCGVCYAM